MMDDCEWDPEYDRTIERMMAQNPGKKHPNTLEEEAKVKNEEEREKVEELRRKKLKGKGVKKRKREVSFSSFFRMESTNAL